MAALILAMLLIGAGMISTTTERYPLLLAWHRPIGLAILILALIRIVVRLMHRPPPLPRQRCSTLTSMRPVSGSARFRSRITI